MNISEKTMGVIDRQSRTAEQEEEFVLVGAGLPRTGTMSTR
jgi:hypothetical protein